MKDVYIKYWKDIPMLYSFAFILDPRAKLKGFNKLLRLLNKFLGVDYSSYLTEVRAQLNIMYKRYDDKFGTVKRRTPTQPTTAGKKKSDWDDILQMMLMMIHLIFFQLLDMVTLIVPLPFLCLEELVLLPCCKQQALVQQLELLWVLVVNSLTIWTVTLSLSLMIASASSTGGMNTNLLIMSFQS